MPRFLVADDSRTVRLAVADALRGTSPAVEVVEAADGAAALAAFEAATAAGAVFDLVFLDMVMPGERSGLDVLSSLLASQPSTRVVLVTALAPDHPDVTTARSLGAFAVLTKPVRFDAVQDVVALLAREGGRMRRIG